jgi:hemerythrin
MLIKWTDTVKTGIDILDEQHKELFNRTNLMDEAYRSGKGKEEVIRMMNFLHEYVVQHLHDEEELMRRFNYPYYKQHKAIHDGFIMDFIKFKTQMDELGPSSFFVIEVKEKIADWWFDHVTKLDKALADFLKDKIS